MNDKIRHRFPFGEYNLRVEQIDRTPRSVFVLTFTSPAVNAAVYRAKGHCIASSMPVASEPEPNWTGENAQDIIDRIPLPENSVELRPSVRCFNARPARQINDCILAPLGYTRDDAWYCYCYQRYCLNPNGWWHHHNVYLPLRAEFGFPKASIRPSPSEIWEERREAIVEELRESGAQRLIAVGSRTVRRCLIHMCDNPERLTETIYDDMKYGDFFETRLNGYPIEMMFCPQPCDSTILYSPRRTGVDWYTAWLQRIGYHGLPATDDLNTLPEAVPPTIEQHERGAC